MCYTEVPDLRAKVAEERVQSFQGPDTPSAIRRNNHSLHRPATPLLLFAINLYFE
jgi:hypothetical protein